MSETLTVSNFTQKAVVSNEKSAMIIECTSKQRTRPFMPGMCHAKYAGLEQIETKYQNAVVFRVSRNTTAFL